MALENTKVLPKGRYSVRYNHHHAEISDGTDASGMKYKLAEKLSKNITFKDLVGQKSGLEKTYVETFLLVNGYEGNEKLLNFQADLKAHVDVSVPSLSYGITDQLTLALFVPIYQARTQVSVGTSLTDIAHRFAKDLSENNQQASLREFQNKMNQASLMLNSALQMHGYQKLGEWNKQAMGDLALGTKWNFYQHEYFKGATLVGLFAPTGRQDDPDNLIDIGFGDGSWDAFSGLIFDQPLGLGFTLNEYTKYNYQFLSKKKIRVPEEEADLLNAKNKNLQVKQGNIWESGASIQWQGQSSFVKGLFTGVGLQRTVKEKDSFYGVTPQEKKWIEKNTDSAVQGLDLQVGYNGISAYLDHEIPFPFEISLGQLRHLSSKNSPIKNISQFDLKMFF